MQIDRTKVDKVYIGRNGCMCGCGGNYHELQGDKNSAKAAKAALTKLEKLITRHEQGDARVTVGSDEKYIYAEEPSRHRLICAYFREG